MHPAQAARRVWSGVASCEHSFTVRQGGSSPEKPNPTDICEHCGATRERAATIQRWLRSVGLEVPYLP